MDIKFAGKTDVGLVREANEDTIELLPRKNLYIVCDGMGGHNAGEVASRTACQVISTLYDKFYDRLLQDETVRLPRVLPPSTDVLIKAVRIANHTVYRMAAENPSFSGMGTTIVAAAVEKDILTLLHVGDSRIYRYADNTLTPLTIDHSWAAELEQSEQISAEEARNLVNRNVITRALGVKENVEIDVAVRKIAENDIYVLCSDGLCGFVDDSDIKGVVAAANGDLDKTVNQLIQLANDRGGMDNVSVVAFKIAGKIDATDLSKLKTVTVEAEPPDYFEAERQWGATAIDHSKVEPEKPPERKSRKKGGGGFLAFSLILIIVVIVFYLIVRG
jgi:serine/threonine protein phosphatase PrpC